MMDKKNLNQIEAALKIENYYICFRNRQLFKLLKNAICSAELFLTKDILKKLVPAEFQFFKNDDFTEMKIKFRFGGQEFPPKVYYKVFMVSDLCSAKEMTSQDIIVNSRNGCFGALRNMGRSKYLGILLNDLQLKTMTKFPPESDVIKPQFSLRTGNYLDDFPARLGGRNNPWRKFDQTILWRNCQVDDAFECINSNNVTNYMKYLFFGSQTDSKNGNSVIVKDKMKKKKKSNQLKKKQDRKQKCEKMFKLYCGRSFESDREINKMARLEIGDQHTFSSLDDDWETDAQILYEWTKELSISIS